MSDEDDQPSTGQQWVVFPEIIPVGIIAIYAPYYLAEMFSAGHVLWAILGSFGWLIGVVATYFCLKFRMYFLALIPMLLVLGVGLLVNNTLFAK